MVCFKWIHHMNAFRQHLSSHQGKQSKHSDVACGNGSCRGEEQDDKNDQDKKKNDETASPRGDSTFQNGRTLHSDSGHEFLLGVVLSVSPKCENSALTEV